MRPYRWLVFLFFLLVLARPSAFAGRDDSEILSQLQKRSSEFMTAMLGGNGHTVQSDLLPHLRPTLNPETARIFFGDLLIRGGGLEEVGLPVMERMETGEVCALVPVRLRRYSIAARITFEQFTPRAKISGFVMDEWDQDTEAVVRDDRGSSLPVDIPVYVVPETIRRIPVDIPAGEVLLKGELVLPATAGEAVPVPCALLLQGLGSYDEDMTVGRAKPFRDLALGMASRGVAALRIETPDRSAAESFGPDVFYDLEDYRLEPARLALEWLHERPEVDAEKTTIVGHGLGGFLAPVLAERTNAQRVVMLSPWPVPVSLWIESRAYEYLRSPAVTNNEMREVWQQTLEQSIALREGSLDSTASIFEIAAPVWKDLERLDPARTIVSGAFRSRLYFPSDDSLGMRANAEEWMEVVADVSSAARVDFVMDVNGLFADADPESENPLDAFAASNMNEALVREITDFARTGRLPVL